MFIGPNKPKFHETYTPQPTPTPEQIEKMKHDLANAQSQLELTRAALREVCADFGFDGWSDYESLPHVVRQHLGWHLYNDALHMPGSHCCALCKEHSPDAVFGKSELLEEKTGNEGMAWICQGCIDKARAEFYGEGE